jgi:hypothetical protein
MSLVPQRLLDWLRPDRRPQPIHFNCHSEQIVERFGVLDAARADQVLAEAEAAYAEAAERADSAERRATTIQGSIAVAASLSIAGGSLLLDPSKITSCSWRWALGSTFAALVACLALAAWRSFLVTGPGYMWASPNFEEVLDHSDLKDAGAIKVTRAADLLVAYGRNDRIAAVKIELLGSAVRWLILALAFVALLAAILAAAVVTR